MQVVEIVLHFVVGQFAVDEVAEVVVVIDLAVVGFQAVVRDGRAIVVGQDIVRGVEVACTFSGNPKRLRSFEQKPRTARTLRRDWRFHAGYGLLFTLLNSGGEFFETHPK